MADMTTKHPIPTRRIDVTRPTRPVTAPAKTSNRLARYAKRWWRLYAAPAVALAIIAGMLLVNHWHQPADQTNLTVVKKEVARHMLLPGNEEPALATITDHTKVTTPFLRDAQNGDKLLIYQKNRKIIIYRPSIDRIVNVVPANLDLPSHGGTQ